MRLTNLWKPAAIALAASAVLIYACLVIHEISRTMTLGAESHARARVDGAFVEEEAMLGGIWAHRNHPHDASWCPDYSPSFRKGCVDALAYASIRKDDIQRRCDNQSIAGKGNAC